MSLKNDVPSQALKASLGVAAIGNGRQLPDLLRALVVLPALVLGLVQLVLLVLNDELPLRLIPVILLVLPHELVVPLLLLHPPLGQQLDQLLLLLLLLRSYAVD